MFPTDYDLAILTDLQIANSITRPLVLSYTHTLVRKSTDKPIEVDGKRFEIFTPYTEEVECRNFDIVYPRKYYASEVRLLLLRLARTPDSAMIVDKSRRENFYAHIEHLANTLPENHIFGAYYRILGNCMPLDRCPSFKLSVTSSYV